MLKPEPGKVRAVFQLAIGYWPKESMAQHTVSTITERGVLKPAAQLTDTY